MHVLYDISDFANVKECFDIAKKIATQNGISMQTKCGRVEFHNTMAVDKNAF